MWPPQLDCSPHRAQTDWLTSLPRAIAVFFTASTSCWKASVCLFVLAQSPGSRDVEV